MVRDQPVHLLQQAGGGLDPVSVRSRPERIVVLQGVRHPGYYLFGSLSYGDLLETIDSCIYNFDAGVDNPRSMFDLPRPRRAPL